VLEMPFMPQTYFFAPDKAATLLSLVWRQAVMNPASSQKMAPWFASPTLFCWTKSMIQDV